MVDWLVTLKSLIIEPPGVATSPGWPLPLWESERVSNDSLKGDGVEVNLVLKRGIDCAQAPQRGATVRSPGRVEQYEDRFPLGHEIGGGDLSVTRERQGVIGRLIPNAVSDLDGGKGLRRSRRRCGR